MFRPPRPWGGLNSAPSLATCQGVSGVNFYITPIGFCVDFRHSGAGDSLPWAPDCWSRPHAQRSAPELNPLPRSPALPSSRRPSSRTSPSSQEMVQFVQDRFRELRGGYDSKILSNGRQRCGLRSRRGMSEDLSRPIGRTDARAETGLQRPCSTSLTACARQTDGRIPPQVSVSRPDLWAKSIPMKTPAPK